MKRGPTATNASRTVSKEKDVETICTRVQIDELKAVLPEKEVETSEVPRPRLSVKGSVPREGS